MILNNDKSISELLRNLKNLKKIDGESHILTEIIEKVEILEDKYMEAQKELNQLRQANKDLQSKQSKINGDFEWFRNVIEKLTDQQDIPKPMPDSQPLFSGHLKEDVDDFLFITEYNFKRANIPDNEKIEIILGYLRGSAIAAYRRIIQDDPDINWKSFTEKLTKRFRRNTVKDPTSKLLALKQTGSINKYVREFRNLFDRTTFDEVMAKMIFIRGLKSEMMTAVERERPKTLEDAIEAAEEEEMVKRELDMMRFQYLKNIGACFKCEIIGHQAKYCQQSRYHGNRKDGYRGFNKNKHIGVLEHLDC